MGAGFIGCIIMEALAMRGVKLSVVEMGDRMVPRMMGPTAGGMIKDWCEKKGVAVYTGARVDAIERPAPKPPVPRPSMRPAPEPAVKPTLLEKLGNIIGVVHIPAPPPPAPWPKPEPATPAVGPMQVRLSTGQVLEADLVISATGVRPNIGFLEHSGVRCLVGVLTDEHLQTNVPGIYAAGDCAEAFDKVSGQTIVSAIQPNAAEQARVAALNMAHRGPTPLAELKGVTQINVLDTLGMISASFGKWDGVPGGEHVELADRAAGKLLSLQFSGDRLIGCNSVGWTEHVGVMRGLVEGEVKLSADWKQRLMHDPTLLMEAYLANAQAQADMALVRQR